MPLHPVAIELLTRDRADGGLQRQPDRPPLAASCDAAQEQLGDSVAIYLDGGPTPAAVPSSIVDVTGKVPRLLRAGALSAEQLREVVPDLEVGN